MWSVATVKIVILHKNVHLWCKMYARSLWNYQHLHTTTGCLYVFNLAVLAWQTGKPNALKLDGGIFQQIFKGQQNYSLSKSFHVNENPVNGLHRKQHQIINCWCEAGLTDICPFVNKVDDVLGKLGPQLCTMQGDLNTIFQVVQHFSQHTVSFSSGWMTADITIR